MFNVKNKGHVVRTRVYALKQEVVVAVRWAWLAEVQHNNKTTIQSSMGPDGHLLLEFKQMCSASQQHFAELYRAHSGSRMKVDFTSYFNGLLWLSAKDAEFCDMLIIAEDVCDVRTSCTRE